MLKTAVAKRNSVESLIADTISGLIGSESLKDRKALTGAILTLRQFVITMEKRGLASKNDVDKCFELIQIMDRER